jgi:hypothetical protein
MVQRSNTELIQPREFRDAIIAQVFEPLGIGENFPDFHQQDLDSAGPAFDEDVDRLAGATSADETESQEDRWVIGRLDIGDVTIRVLRNGPVYYVGNYRAGSMGRTDERLTVDRRLSIAMPFPHKGHEARLTTKIQSVGRSTVKVYDQHSLDWGIPDEAKRSDDKPHHTYSIGYLEDVYNSTPSTLLTDKQRQKMGWQKRDDKTMGLCIGNEVMAALQPHMLEPEGPPAERLYYLSDW